MEEALNESWRTWLGDELKQPYFRELAHFVAHAYRTECVYPPAECLFAAFNRTPPDHVKVVILGQDPYPGPGQAHGLSFSVPRGVKIPPSLANIFKEIDAEYAAPAGDLSGHRKREDALAGAAPARTGDLSSWADQGVLLLNATLTVRAGCPGSHQGHGWETFTRAVVARLAAAHEHLVFMLCGASAQAQSAHIDPARHLVLTAPHPSPLAAWRGFFGCGHFRAANTYLAAHGRTPIAW